jgi:hypothetical protein
MTTACAISVTERRRGPTLAAALLALALPGAALAAQAPPVVQPATPVELRDRFGKVQKLLRKAGEALRGKDLSRASFLLQRTDEELTRFEGGSNVSRYLASFEEARKAADAGTLPAAETALKAARTALPPLGDYSVPRSMEIAYRAALQGAAEGSVEAFRTGLQQMDEATSASAIAAGCAEIRAAMGRARKAMGRNDAVAGGKEVEAANAALARIDYGGRLARARSGLLLASELLRDGAFLAARDQTQRGLRELAGAIESAPAADRDALTTAQEETRTVWRRMSRAEKEDPDRLAAASDRVETLRRALRSQEPAREVNPAPAGS